MTDYTNLRKIVTGDIIVKCRFGNDIRRIPINQVPTYDELYLMMCRVFKDKLKSSEDIVLKYMDNEGDMISLLDDVDITHAISISNLLKVTIYDKSTFEHQSQLLTSLMEVRDSLNELIQSFDIKKDELLTESSQEQVSNLTRKLTAAELAKFDTSKNDSEEKSSVKELTSLSPKVNTSIPYYPPPTPQQQHHPQPPTPQRQSSQGYPQQQPIQGYPQQHPPAPQQQQQQQQQKAAPQQMQQHTYIHTPSVPGQVLPVSQAVNPVTAYPPPPSQQQQHQQQQQQYKQQPLPLRHQPPPPLQQQQQPQQSKGQQGFNPPPNNYPLPPQNSADSRLQSPYFVPPPPSNMNTPTNTQPYRW